MSAFLKPFATLVSPTFYRAQWAGMIKSLNAEFVSGSISPLYKVIALVGFTGYVVEYTAVGRHHVLHKHAIVSKALANEHH